VTSPSPRPDLTGWDAHLRELGEGLDLAVDHHQYRLARRIANRMRRLGLDDGEQAELLRALAQWLGHPTRATTLSTLRYIVATAWAAKETNLPAPRTGATWGAPEILDMSATTAPPRSAPAPMSWLTGAAADETARVVTDVKAEAVWLVLHMQAYGTIEDRASALRTLRLVWGDPPPVEPDSALIAPPEEPLMTDEARAEVTP
jgi:hypothetical protein